MAGDPCQLPPVVAAPASVTIPAASAAAGAVASSPRKQPLTHSSRGAAVSGGAVLTERAVPSERAVPTGGADPIAGAVPTGGAIPAGNAGQCSVRGAALHGLARPLLVRLVQMGLKAHLLRTQYRQAAPTFADSQHATLSGACTCCSSTIASRVAGLDWRPHVHHDLLLGLLLSILSVMGMCAKCVVVRRHLLSLHSSVLRSAQSTLHWCSTEPMLSCWPCLQLQCPVS